MATRLYLVILLLLILASANAQFTYVLDTAVSVENAAGKLPMPWAGGLNAAQYSTADIDLDGQDDIVIYDRMANKVITFLKKNNTYLRAPQYDNAYPTGITNWMLMRDYNGDGKKDIFTGDNLGMKVYTNVTTSNVDGPKWEQLLFYTGGPTKSQVVLTRGADKTKLVNLQLQFDDLPAIIDADGDGDLDIFTIQYASNGTIEYHENISGSLDSLAFDRKTNNWGDVTECTCGVFSFSGSPCPARTEHAGGKSLLAIDATGDGQLDIMLSEAACTTMSLLPNNGTLTAPSITSSSLFPASRPVSLIMYPAAYYEDLDFDGVKDLVMTPNVYRNDYPNHPNADFNHSNWLYKNTGTNEKPVFSLTKRNFLQDQMIDVGENAVPVFFDIDNDGDMDMLVSHFTSDLISARIYLYRNTGTPTHPAFRLDDEDFLGFTSSLYYNLKIQIVDLNNDNRQDLVFTATSRQNNRTRLYYIANQSTTGLNFAQQEIQQVNFSLNIDENIHFIDISGDGLLDILVGTDDGALEYWRNTGPVANPSFTLVNNRYLGIGSSVTRQNLAVATGDLNADGKTDLVLGDQTGEIYIYSNFREATGTPVAETEIIYNPLTNVYQPRNLGGRVWPTVVNLFDMDKPAIVVGNTLGGIAILRNDNSQSLPSEPHIEIFPNPVSKTGPLTLHLDRAATLQIFTATGRAIYEPGPIALEGNETFELKLPNLASGVYLLRFMIRNRSYTKRLVVY